MNIEPLNDKIHLCYIDFRDLEQWIKENCLLEQDFTRKKTKWAQEINQRPNFFSDAELLLIHQDVLLLKVFAENQAFFLAKTYQLEYQNICKKLFWEPKNIFLVSGEQWKKMNSNFLLFERKKEHSSAEKVVVLLKDREIIAEKLAALLSKD